MRYKPLQVILLASSIILILSTFAILFEQIPTDNNSLAMDWKIFFPSLRDGIFHYRAENGILFPPWSVIPLLILGFFPLQTGWGILAGLSIMLLTGSVPKSQENSLPWLPILLLLISFPSLRNIADGNVESIVIGGILLLLYGYPSKNVYAVVAGILIASIKFQEISLLLAVLGLYILVTWHKKRWLKLGFSLTGIITLSLLWRGKSWFQALIGANQKFNESIFNITLTSTIKRLELPAYFQWTCLILIIGISLLVAWKSKSTLSREKAGMLIAGSLLISPYATPNSVLTLFAIGIIPLFQSNHLLGTIFIILFNLPILFSPEILYKYQAYYWTLVMLISWGLLIWQSLEYKVFSPPVQSQHKLSKQE